jgi:hypothetical protein
LLQNQKQLRLRATTAMNFFGALSAVIRPKLLAGSRSSASHEHQPAELLSVRSF